VAFKRRLGQVALRMAASHMSSIERRCAYAEGEMPSGEQTERRMLQVFHGERNWSFLPRPSCPDTPWDPEPYKHEKWIMELEAGK
jgi:hypothetical protein